MADPAHVQMQMQGVGPPQVQGLPPALNFLAGLSEVNIHQHLDILEVAIGWEKNNKYRLCNSQDQQFMYAKEDTDCCVRQMCGPARPFTMNITDNNEQPLIQLYRPFRCQASLCMCCYLQEMDIMSPPGLSVGGVKQLWTPWKPKFEVHDAQNTPLFHILGECCFCCPCTDITFQVVDAQKGHEIGQIIKHWGGCREICGAVNDFKVTFPADLDVMKKTLLLGSTFLIDFNYFERNKNQ
ncbi:phospholipid scramblase 2-like [Mytilus californianus]|uniref:phospholipid scramblase 2-like n=1 Tax=Mytilus californianus TaxID=6549 RepID=UPI002247329A|nr:phospholipid scramblase 2-like [Mytilus californianus]XP_052059781.1 phospholipid scramblase 2-like [Mytilus californianus]